MIVIIHSKKLGKFCLTYSSFITVYNYYYSFFLLWIIIIIIHSKKSFVPVIGWHRAGAVIFVFCDNISIILWKFFYILKRITFWFSAPQLIVHTALINLWGTFAGGTEWVMQSSSYCLLFSLFVFLPIFLGLGHILYWGWLWNVLLAVCFFSNKILWKYGEREKSNAVAEA